MNRTRGLSPVVVVFGAVAVLAQVLVFRECVALSLGNELAVGLIFSGWLLGVAVGSAAGGAVSQRMKPSSTAIALVLILLTFFLPASMCLARMLRPMAGLAPGETVSFASLCWMLPLLQFPVSALVGLGFVWLCAYVKNVRDEASHAMPQQDISAPAPPAVPAPEIPAEPATSTAVSESDEQLEAEPADAPEAAPGTPGMGTVAARVYTLEMAGSVAGSLLFSFILVFVMLPMRQAFLAAAAMCGALFVWRNGQGGARGMALVFGVAALGMFLFGAGALDQASRRAQWKGFNVERTAESPHGTLAAVRDKEQVSFFSNGRLQGTIPDRVDAAFRVHIPLSLHDAPKHVLIAGGGAAMVREVFKHDAESVTLVELDPVLLTMREEYLNSADYGLMIDERVHREVMDARRFIMRTKKQFDAIIVHAGEPDTLVANRYYTHEFFQAVKKRLRPGGVFAMGVTFQQNSMSAWQADLLGTHLRTLAPLLGRPLLAVGRGGAMFVAAKGRALEYDPVAAGKRFKKRGIEADNFSEATLLEVLDPRRVGEALKQPRLIGKRDMKGLLEYDLLKDKPGYVFERLEKRAGARVNRDFRPVSTYYQTRVSSEYYGGWPAKFLRAVDGLQLARAWVAVLAVLAVVVILLRFAGVLGATGALWPGVAAAGFAGLAVEVAAVFAYQALYGVVYYFIGVIIAAFMAGGWLGAKFARRRLHAGASPGMWLGACMLGLAALCAALAMLFGAGAGGVVLPAVFVTGVLVGAVYPFAVARAGSDRAAGRLYAADHAGAALGALAAAALFIPLLGLPGALWLCTATLLCCIGPALVAGSS